MGMNLNGNKFNIITNSSPDNINDRCIDKNESDTFMAGWIAAKERIKNSRFLQGLIPEGDILKIKGVVTNVNGDEITVKIEPVEPLADPKFDVRKVSVSDDTKIFLLENKSSEQINKDQEEYNKQLQTVLKTGGDFPIPVDPYIRKEVGVESLTPNIYIAVKTDRDVREELNFQASEIEIYR